MTVVASDRLVGAGQRELCLIVIPVCWYPGSGCVTRGAVLIEVRLDMVGIDHADIVAVVTAVAIAWRSRVPIGMAIVAIDGLVGAR